MMHEIIPLILFTISTTFTPGPNNILIMNSGITFGIKPSLPHYLGICVGFPIMVLFIAIGLGQLFIHYGWIKLSLKIIGSTYMLYLAYQLLQSHNKINSHQAKKPFTFIQALLFQWVNPKAWLMAVSVISIFTLSDQYYQSIFIICIIYFLTCLPFTGVWLLFGHLLQRILKNEKHRVRLNVFLALSLVASIFTIIVD